MNESLLNALMELIALFARINKTRFIDNAHSLLKTYLDQSSAYSNSRQHIRKFQEHFEAFTHSDRDTITDESSIRNKIQQIVKNISTELNEEERMVLFLSFLELIKLDKKVESDELLFIEVLSIELHISRTDYQNCLIFTLCDDSEINQDDNADFIVITDEQKETFDDLEGSWIEQNRPQEKAKKLYLYKNDLDGDVLIVRLQSINLLAGRYFGNHHVFINNKRIFPGKFFLIGQFDVLRIGNNAKFSYSEIIAGFKSNLPNTGLKFIGENVSTQPKVPLIGFAPFNFCEEPGNLVMILCNDTSESRNISLLLTGQLPLATGKIYLNGYNIITERYKVHKMISLVPRENLFDENISIYNNFWFSARLAFPGYPNQKIKKLVEQTISNLGIKDFSHTPIKKISCGIAGEYLKILINTGFEIIRDPFILVLDLPLEKLNSTNAEEFCSIIKSEANKGKLIFVTSINPGTCVLKKTDRIWIFDLGGFLIFRGSANHVFGYFKKSSNNLVTDGEICPICGNINAEQLYQIIHSKIIDNQGKLTHSRKTSPKEWYKLYKTKIEEKEERTESRKVIPSYASSIPNVNIQFKAYLKKQLLSLSANPFKPLKVLLGGLILAFVISGLLRYDWTPNFSFARHEYLPLLFFLNTVICFITGVVLGLLFTIDDKLHVAFDHFKNYSFFSYLNVKYVLLTFITLFFSLIFTFITDIISGIHDLFILNWLIYFSCIFIGGSIGLFWGFICMNVRNAVFSTSIFLASNILFSGYILPYNSLPKQIASAKYVPAYAEIFPGRWAYEALVVQQVKDNSFQKNLFKTEQTISDLSFKTNILIPKLQEDLFNIQNQSNKLPQLSPFYYALTEINKKYPDIFQFEFLEELNKKEVNIAILMELEDYIRYVQFQLYEKLQENITIRNELRQNLIDSLGSDNYERLVDNNYNSPLYTFVSAKKPGKNFIVNEGEIIQVDEPIYRLPDNNFGRSHFFAPQKLMNGFYYDTTYFNLFVLWLEIFVFYILTLILRRKSVV